LAPDILGAEAEELIIRQRAGERGLLADQCRLIASPNTALQGRKALINISRFTPFLTPVISAQPQFTFGSTIAAEPVAIFTVATSIALTLERARESCDPTPVTVFDIPLIHQRFCWAINLVPACDHGTPRI
jgi:hypothetical protein